jgi:hypothetical protein
MKSLAGFAAAVVVLGSACTKLDLSALAGLQADAAAPPSTVQVEPDPAQTQPQVQQPGTQIHPNAKHHPVPAHSLASAAPQVQRGVLAQPAPSVASTPPASPTPPNASPQPAAAKPSQPGFTRPDAVEACKNAENEWRQACGCPIKIVIDLASFRADQDSEGEEFFELAGKHFCEDVHNGDDIHAHPIGIGKFCKGREKDMCKITTVRVEHVPSSAGFACPFSNGTAVVHANGLTRTANETCYKHVTTF